jgi:hypothetical protein
MRSAFETSSAAGGAQLLGRSRGAAALLIAVALTCSIAPAKADYRLHACKPRSRRKSFDKELRTDARTP